MKFGIFVNGYVPRTTSRAVTTKVAGPPPAYMVARGWYRDRLEQTEHGWQIAERVETLADLQT